MPELEVYRGEVPEHLMWQVVATMRELWPDVFTGDRTWMAHSYPPDLPATHVVVHYDRVMVAYAAVIRLAVGCPGGDLAVDALGSVITARPYRGQGHGTRVQERVAEIIDSGDADVAGLFCAPDSERFYARTGWVTCPGGTLLGPPDAATPVDAGLRMMRFVSARGRAERAELVARPWRVDWTW
jgi:GNAT superfamily N-acetyltransferase